SNSKGSPDDLYVWLNFLQLTYGRLRQPAERSDIIREYFQFHRLHHFYSNSIFGDSNIGQRNDCIGEGSKIVVSAMPDTGPYPLSLSNSSACIIVVKLV